MHSLTSFKKLTSKPLLFLPNNYTLFDKEYEFETAYLTALNAIYWRHGYINDGAGNYVSIAPKAASMLNFLMQGGLCYMTGIDPVKLNVSRYETFRLKWNPEYTSNIKYTRREDPVKDVAVVNVNGSYLYKWTTALQSFLTQSIGTNLRITNKDLTIPFLGANCPMVPFSDYIYSTLIGEYIKDGECIYPTHEGNNNRTEKNSCIYTYADYMSTKYVLKYSFNEIFYNNIVNRLLRSHITFPYNNILSTSFINTAHFLWHDYDIPTDMNAESWNKVVLPQYILTRANLKLEASVFNKPADTSTFNSSTATPVTLAKGSPIGNILMRVCDAKALPTTPCPS
jgi:hypothetical protein